MTPHPTMSRPRQFDWSYYLLVPFLVIGLIPWLKYRIPFRFLLPLPILWVALNFGSIKARMLPKPAEGYFYKWCALLLVTVFMRFLYGLIHANWLMPGTAEGIDMFFVFLVFCVLHCSVNSGRIRELRFTVIVCLFSLIASSLVSIRGLDVVEGGARLLTGASGGTVAGEDIMAIMQEGIGSYGHVYGAGLLVAPLIWLGLKMKGNIRLLLYTAVPFLALVAIKGGFSILIVGLTFSVFSVMLIALGIRGISFWVTVGLGIFSIVLVLSTPDILKFMLPVLDSLSTVTENPDYLLRIKSVGDFIQGSSESYAAERAQLYWNSLEVFMTAPITGYSGFSDPSEFNVFPGGHSYVFDILASYGLVGFSFFVAFYALYFKYMKMLFVVTGHRQYTAVIHLFFSSYFLISFLNPIGGFVMVTDYLLILPGLVFFAKPKFERGPYVQHNRAGAMN